MSTLYELQNEYEKLETKAVKIREEQREIVHTYKTKLINAIFETNLLSKIKWTIGNCGTFTHRLDSIGDWPIDFEPFNFIGGHSITLLPKITLGVYTRLQLTFKRFDLMIDFINKHNLSVDDSLKKQIRINELESEIFELNNAKS